ncbi:MAG: hypothetical protein ILO34_05480 [Kiritimatiellae bacterium]|nr:hypothetical protein [Kiritimatiellia bacterium]
MKKILCLLSAVVVFALLWWFWCGRVSNKDVRDAVLEGTSSVKDFIDQRASDIEDQVDRLGSQIVDIDRKLDGIDRKLDRLIKMATPQLPADNLDPAAD